MYELESMSCMIGCYTRYYHYGNFLIGLCNMYKV